MPIAAWARCALLFVTIVPGACLADVAFDEDDRFSCAKAIEEMRWSHRVWPKENPGPKPPLSAVLDDSRILADVRDAMRQERALADLYDIRMDAATLQAEIDRMVKNSHAPAQLDSLFVTLDRSPRKVAECLARPALVRRLLRNAWQWDARYHASTRIEAETSLRKQATLALPERATDTLLTYVPRDAASAATKRSAARDTIEIPQAEWHAELAKYRAAQSPALHPSLRETATGFVFESLVESRADRFKVRILHWPKAPFDRWWRKSAGAFPAGVARIDASGLRLPDSAAPNLPVEADTWRAEAMPERRVGHFALWTGEEMIVWGGRAGGWNAAGYSEGGRYRPATDSWESLATPPEVDAPAVWTGTRMIQWGNSQAGSQYDPVQDAWTPIATAGAPTARFDHSILWTGEEVIVWGGFELDGGENAVANGARYNPAQDSWQSMASAAAGRERARHAAIWAGDRMVVLSGVGNVFGGGQSSLGDSYDPAADQWMPLPEDGSLPRSGYLGAWSGTHLLAWDGVRGGRYDPIGDTWEPIDTAGAPQTRFHNAIAWSGSEMLVWGSDWVDDDYSTPVTDSGRYDPGTDTWQSITSDGAPSPRFGHTLVWTGAELIVWGGASEDGSANTSLATGARYNPLTDQWIATSTHHLLEWRRGHSAVWTGNEMIVWGGDGATVYDDGGRYEPATDQWTPTQPVGAPAARYNQAALWTGTEMIVYGGVLAGSEPETSPGSRYNPQSDQWTPLPAIEPTGRWDMSMVWTGSEIIVWGGVFSLEPSGIRLNPATGIWAQIESEDAPSGNRWHGVWSGDEMLVVSEGGAVETRGGRYNPVTDTWAPMSSINAPSSRDGFSLVWTGDEMILWGGGPAFVVIQGENTGARYSPATDTWSPTETAAAATPRYDHTAIWSGSQMIVWGGMERVSSSTRQRTDTGGRYSPDGNAWHPVSTDRAPIPRNGHSAIWTGSHMLVWGGWNTNSLGIYAPSRIRESIIFKDDFDEPAALAN